MELKQLFTDEDAVSPVIGVILMVAITVILAAVIGTFVLGLGQNVQQTAPQASFSFEVTNSSYNVVVTHDGGDAIAASDLNLSASTDFKNPGTSDAEKTSYSWSALGASGDVTAGTSVNATGNNSKVSGETFRVVWNSPDSEKSQTLRKFDVPS